MNTSIPILAHKLTNYNYPTLAASCQHTTSPRARAFYGVYLYRDPVWHLKARPVFIFKILSTIFLHSIATHCGELCSKGWSHLLFLEDFVKQLFSKQIYIPQLRHKPGHSLYGSIKTGQKKKKTSVQHIEWIESKKEDSNWQCPFETMHIDLHIVANSGPSGMRSAA